MSQGRGTIPIVMTQVADPERDGFVASLARPGANITGLTHMNTELAGKRLELLKESVPRQRPVWPFCGILQSESSFQFQRIGDCR